MADFVDGTFRGHEANPAFAVGFTVHLCAAGIGVVLANRARGRARATARGR
ncbi:hypothetical protein [Streptomyces sp. E2N166]|uniref:hypothetical protein n=1 Tax=Streptomyces sp. E2N166 TaxID=1851909 RepID=UPI00187D5B00|nr:hypothetical protein [Streptomyces sp. E2N166]